MIIIIIIVLFFVDFWRKRVFLQSMMGVCVKSSRGDILIQILFTFHREEEEGDYAGHLLCFVCFARNQFYF